MRSKTVKVMDIRIPGVPHLIVRYEGNRKQNRWCIYNVWYDCGMHQKLLVNYEEKSSVGWWLKDFLGKYVMGVNGVMVLDGNNREIEFK